MITCYLRYIIDPYKNQEFEEYAKMWIPLVNKFGGTHHGYFLHHEGANNIAYALFSFPSLSTYEEYREKIDIIGNKKQGPFRAQCRQVTGEKDPIFVISTGGRNLCGLARCERFLPPVEMTAWAYSR